MEKIRKLNTEDTGAVLIGLIIAMVIISTIGAAMLPQTSVGIFSLVGENSSTQAYYHAESGFRYAAAKIIHGTEMNILHNHGEYALGNEGGFTVEFNPYLFDITGGDGTSELVASVPFGDAPPISSSAGVGNFYYAKTGVVTEAFDSVARDVAPDENMIRFTKTGTWNVSIGQRIRMVVKSDGTSLSEGGDLMLRSTSPADLFPLRNGYIFVDNKTYRYEKRETDRLVGVTRVGASWGSSPSLSDGDDIVLKNFMTLTSTGRVGTGGTMTTREITYSIPLTESGTIEFHDTFEDRSHWEGTSSEGSHAIETIGGDKALKVTGTSEMGGGIEKSLIGFDSSTTDIDFGRTRGVAGGYLSYNVQVKTGFDPDVPLHYMPGISFRLDNATGYSYGVSFQHADCFASDGIPNDLVPAGLCGNPGIVLWQEAGSGQAWLAWKKLTPLDLFWDDMESGVSGWTPENPWAQDSSGGNTWWSDSPGIQYNNNVDTSLISQHFDFSSLANVTLKFKHRYDIQPKFWFFGWIWTDWGAVEVSDDGGSNWVRLIRYEGSQLSWTDATVTIPDIYLTDNFRIRFRLETNGSNTYGGWLIDDVRIEADFFPVDEATLLARVIEAASVEFTNGGTVEIEVGDILVSNTNNAKGVVVGKPIVESGSWAGANAEGIIRVKNVTKAFAIGPLNVEGKGTDLAVATGFRDRDNYIQVYYGNKDGYGTPNDDPLDYEKQGLPRNTTAGDNLVWPPGIVDNTEAANDYYTLVKWDDYNSAEADLFGGGVEVDTIVRSDELTTDSGTVSDPELGLHTYGQGVFSTNVFFDDFAVLIEAPTGDSFYPAVQE